MAVDAGPTEPGSTSNQKLLQRAEVTSIRHVSHYRLLLSALPVAIIRHDFRAREPLRNQSREFNSQRFGMEQLRMRQNNCHK
eukprot:5759456-Amphidinium_carterae.1